MNVPIYRFTVNSDQLALAITKVLSSHQVDTPFPGRLDADEEQLLGSMTSDVFDLLAISDDLVSLESTPSNTSLSLDYLGIDDYRDGEGMLDGLNLTVGLRHHDGQSTSRTKISGIFIDSIRSDHELGGQTELAAQVRTFVEHLLARATIALNSQIGFYHSLLNGEGHA